MLAGTIAVSAAIVFPLWYFSTHDRTGYTIVVLALFACGFLALVLRRTGTFWRLPARERRLRIKRLVIRVIVFIGYLIALYAILGFFVVGLLAVAIPLSVAYLFALGYTLYVRKSRVRE